MQRSSIVVLLLVAALAAAAFALRTWSGGGVVPMPAPAEPAAAANGGDAPASVGPLPAAPAGWHGHVAVRTERTYVAPPRERVVARRGERGAALPTTLLAGEGAGFDPPPARAGTALVLVADGDRQWLRQVALPAEGLAECRIGAPVVLHGRVVDERELPVRGARVWLGELDADGVRVEVESDASGEWSAAVAAGAGVPWVVAAPGKATQWRAITVAAPGAELATRPRAGSEVSVQLGVAADDVALARVFVVPSGPIATGLAAWPFFLQALDDGFVVDGNGRARVTGLPREGALGVSVRHPRVPGAPAVVVPLRGATQQVVVPMAPVAEVVRGRVVDAEGAALPGVPVWVRRPGQVLDVPGTARLLPPGLPVRGACATVTDGDGAFVVGRPAERDAVLSLRAPGRAGLDLSLAQLPEPPFVLPSWSGGEPSFRLLPPVAGATWSASTDLGGGVRATLGPDEPWSVSFPHAGRFALELTTSQDVATVATATLPTLDVTGPIELQAPRRP